MDQSCTPPMTLKWLLGAGVLPYSVEDQTDVEDQLLQIPQVHATFQTKDGSTPSFVSTSGESQAFVHKTDPKRESGERGTHTTVLDYVTFSRSLSLD